MLPLNKILSAVVATSYLALASLCVSGQIKIKQVKVKQPKNNTIIIGFRSGREILFNPSPLIHSKQSKENYGISSALVLRKSLNTHFMAEAGLCYTTIQNSQASNDKSFVDKYITPHRIALPVTIEYFLLPEHCRVRPYIGAGAQCNINVAGSNNAISPFTSDTRDNSSSNAEELGTKYISILFTQGVTFQVNTKIQINQSFHFIPDNANKVFGIDLGVGYTLP